MSRSQGEHRSWSALGIRVVAGVIFTTFGLAKFTSHPAEVRSFHGYGLPAPAAVVYLVGVIEMTGGVLLLTGLLVRLAAVVLAADMIGAIVVSGAGRGETISLTLAPALLIAMVMLLRLGAGPWSLGPRRAWSGR